MADLKFGHYTRKRNPRAEGFLRPEGLSYPFGMTGFFDCG
jgi:hypothetical protein